jgi:hypothetical protein
MNTQTSGFPGGTQARNESNHPTSSRMKALQNRPLPQFVRDLLGSPPRRGGGLNLWFYRVARLLHPYRTAAEIERLLMAATAGQPVKRGEIERAVANSAATAWQPGQRIGSAPVPAWPRVNAEQREAIVASALGLVDLWEASPVRFDD